MKTRIRKWGNSLAVRIPRAFAEEVGLRNASPVEVSLVEGALVVAPVVTAPKYSLRGLLSEVTEENRHGEYDTGIPVGREEW